VGSLRHVSKPGRLPNGLAWSDRVGGAPGGSSYAALSASIAPILDEVFGAAKRAARPTTQMAFPAPTQLPQFNPPSHVVTPRPLPWAVKSPDEPEFTARYTPAVPVKEWQTVDHPMAHEWLERLSSGPPLGRRAIRGLCGASIEKVPSMPPRDGQTLLIPHSVVVGNTGAYPKWRVCKHPLPGWSLEEASLRKCTDYCLVPAEPGVVSRYEVSGDGMFQINRQFMVPAHRTTIWVYGPVVVRFVSRPGMVWRFVPGVGPSIIGEMALHLARGYDIPAVVTWKNAILSERVVASRLLSQDARGDQFRYVAKLTLQPGTTRVLVHVNGEAQMVAVQIRLSGVTIVELHDVQLPISKGKCFVVAQSDKLAFLIGLDEHGNSEAEFEICRPVEAVATRKLLTAATSEPSASWV